MITDKNEAFKHNSCKKVAQLSKVIVTMRNNGLDRIFNLKKISKQYDKFITQLFDDHRKSMEDISHGLFRYRKTAIDIACKDYGQIYKETKVNYNELATRQINFLNDISKQAKDMGQLISGIT